LDIVSIDIGGDCSVVFYGRGDGTFRNARGGLAEILPERARTVRRPLPAGSVQGQRALDPTTYDPYGPYFILLADLAGDHRARAVVLRAYPGLQVNGQPSVGFQGADVADFDGDGHLDVVVLGGAKGRRGAVAVHPGVGD